MKAIMKVNLSFTVFLLNFLTLLLSSSAEIPAEDDGEDVSSYSTKIGNSLSTKLGLELKSNVFIILKAGVGPTLANVSSQHFTSREERAQAVYDALYAHCSSTQKPVLSLLAKLKIIEGIGKIQSYWISNQIYVQGVSKNVISAVAQLSVVAKIEEEEIIHLEPPTTTERFSSHRQSPTGIEWSLTKMQVPDVWNWCCKGSGVKVGVIDTGVRASHEAIRDRYMNDGRSWRDPYNQYFVPTDIYDHGTHVTGSVLGRNGIGVAPEAKFIACKGYKDDGSAQSSAFFECGQFLVCPTDVYGRNSDCSKVVHVAQNSWGMSLGGSSYKDVLDVWHSVGIKPIFANGNYGPTCALVYSPADNVDAIGIGATDPNDRLADFSGRGPSQFNVLKPDWSAPGTQIYSCDSRSDTSYSIKQGTSMASPIAAGAVALMVNYYPSVSYDQMKTAFQETANKQVVALGQSCGGVSDTTWPNNHYGHGRINVYQALVKLYYMVVG